MSANSQHSDMCTRLAAGKKNKVLRCTSGTGAHFLMGNDRTICQRSVRIVQWEYYEHQMSWEVMSFMAVLQGVYGTLGESSAGVHTAFKERDRGQRERGRKGEGEGGRGRGRDGETDRDMT